MFNIVSGDVWKNWKFKSLNSILNVIVGCDLRFSEDSAIFLKFRFTPCKAEQPL